MSQGRNIYRAFVAICDLLFLTISGERVINVVRLVNYSV
jgi:hypothetical protein